MKRTLIYCAALALAVAGSWSSASGIPPDAASARQWLEKMIQATQTLNYEGVFIYVQGSHVEAMRIVHGGGPEGERQRLFALSGPNREIVVANNSVICRSADPQANAAGDHYPRSSFPVSIPSELGRLEGHYDFALLGEDRVAGLDTQIIAIQPRDHWRFGYRLWLDRNTGMVLRSTLLDEKGSPLEQLMFTDFQIKPQIDEAEFKAPAALPANPTGETTQATPGEPVTQSVWRVEQVPDGFVKVLHNRFAKTADRRQTEHLVFADGLATISVFLEKLDGAPAVLQGPSQLGSMNAFGTTVDGYQVLVVGEAPAATVERIAAAIHRADEVAQP
jgi:sigma-E factor negative regulatory protein RseB